MTTISLITKTKVGNRLNMSANWKLSLRILPGTWIVFLFLLPCPRLPAEAPVLSPPVIASNRIEFTLTGQPGLLHEILVSTNLSGTNWALARVGATPIPFTEASTNRQRFYRGRSLTNVSISLSGGVQPIFTANCAVTGCHTGVAPAQGLNLSAGKSYGALVNVPAVQCTGGTMRVLPGDPAASYLIRKLLGVNLCGGSPMPRNAPTLPAAQIESIAQWILNGAPNN